MGKGWVGEVHSPGTSDSATARSSIGHTGSPVSRLSTYANPCFESCTSALIGTPSTSMSTRMGAVGMS